MSITEDLLAFSSTRQAWEQDLFRRVYTQPELTEDDFVEVLAMVKSGASIALASQSIKPVPLAVEHVLHRPDGADPVVLGSISDIHHAMQLASGQTLSFAVQGITIVYGENGSGKSGYCKLLKQICRARRERSEEVILENAYSNDRVAKPSLTVRFKVGDDAAQDHGWETGAAPPEALSRVTVFDSRLAPLYADKQDKLEFLPAGLDVLPRVVKACEELTKRLAAEMEPIRTLVSVALPEMVPQTPQAEAVATLSEKFVAKAIPSAQHFESLAEWSEADDDQMLSVEDDIRSDPGAVAREKMRGVAIIAKIYAELQQAEALVSAEGIANLSASVTTYTAARDAAV
jgi:ABC-type cobalamin/Fe3+-siderophores transport system ATPase subunit